MEILNNHNNERIFCNKINKSQYLQTINKTNTQILYPNIIELLFTYFDHHYSMVEGKDKDLYIKQRLIEIATKIEEESSSFYCNFNYNKKMSIPIIQYGLQNMNNVSSLLYLADLYNISIIVYLKGVNKKIITSDKNRKVFHIVYTSDGKWYSIDKLTEELESYVEYPISELSECLVLDVSTKDIYVRFLGGISNYKVSKLIEMAKERDIPLIKDSKKKVKKQLYDDINLYELNKSM